MVNAITAKARYFIQQGIWRRAFKLIAPYPLLLSYPFNHQTITKTSQINIDRYLTASALKNKTENNGIAEGKASKIVRDFSSNLKRSFFTQSVSVFLTLYNL